MTSTLGKSGSSIPKGRQRHHSYDVSVDAPEKLIEDEPAEVEQEIPSEESQPEERIEENGTEEPATFEE